MTYWQWKIPWTEPTRRVPSIRHYYEPCCQEKHALIALLGIGWLPSKRASGCLARRTCCYCWIWSTGSRICLQTGYPVGVQCSHSKRISRPWAGEGHLNNRKARDRAVFNRALDFDRLLLVLSMAVANNNTPCAQSDDRVRGRTSKRLQSHWKHFFCSLVR